MNIENQRMMGHDHMHAGHLLSSGEEELDEVTDNMTNGFDSHHLQPPTVAISGGGIRHPQRHSLTKSLSGTVCYMKGVTDFCFVLVHSLGVLVNNIFLIRRPCHTSLHCTVVKKNAPKL